LSTFHHVYNMKHIYIEGVLGAGKSSLLGNISGFKVDNIESLIPIPEPVHDFTSLQSTSHSSTTLNPLKLYKNNKSESLACQLHILQVYKNQTKKINNSKKENSVCVWDRGMSSTLVFAKSMKRLNYLSELEFEIFVAYFNEAVTNSCVSPSSIIFLDTPIETCIERLQIRNHDYDEINLEYLTILRHEYIQSLNHLNCRVQIITEENLELNKLTQIVFNEIQYVV